MPRVETVNFLLDRPLALFVVLAIGAAIGIVLERVTTAADRERRKAYWRGRNASKFGKKGATLKTIEEEERKQARGVELAADQLKLVSSANSSSSLKMEGRALRLSLASPSPCASSS